MLALWRVFWSGFSSQGLLTAEDASEIVLKSWRTKVLAGWGLGCPMDVEIAGPARRGRQNVDRAVDEKGPEFPRAARAA